MSKAYLLLCLSVLLVMLTSCSATVPIPTTPTPTATATIFHPEKLSTPIPHYWQLATRDQWRLITIANLRAGH
jgi:hypothetical protein